MNYINEPYQGWTNAQTWCVAGFLNNQKETQDRAILACDGKTIDAECFGSAVLQTIVDNLQHDVVAFADWCWPEGYQYELVDWIELSKHFHEKAKEQN